MAEPHKNTATAQDVLETNPDKKGKEWCTMMARNMYSMYKDAGMAAFLGQKNSWIENRRYARGEQDITKYKKMMDRNSQTEQYDYLSFENLKILPEYCDIQTGILNKVGMKVSCKALDPFSMDKKLEERLTAEAEVLLRPQLKEIEQASGYKMTNDEQSAATMFTSMESIRLYFDTEFKMPVEISMEMVIDGTFYVVNDINEIKQQLQRDFRECGMAGIKHYVTAYNGLIRLRRVDPVNIITSFTKDCGFTDIRQVGELLFINILTLKQSAGDQFTEKEYLEIAQKYSGKYGNPVLVAGADPSYYSQPMGGFIYDKFTVIVLDCEFLTTDKIKISKYKNRYGNDVIQKKTADYEADKKSGKKVTEVCFDRWYKCSWVVGSDYSYSWGLLEFPNVPEHNLNMPKSSYTLQAIELNDMLTSPMISRAKAIVDQIQLTWLQMQNFIAKSIPPGIAVDIMALLDITDGSGGTMKPLDLIERYVKTGNLLMKGITADGIRDKRLPIESLGGAVSPNLAVFSQLLDKHISRLSEVLGLNEFTNASTPSPESAVGVAQLSAQSTFNSLYPTIHAMSQVLKRTAEGVVNRAQHLAGNGELNYMINAIGPAAVATLAVTKDLSAPVFGIVMEVDTDTKAKTYLEQNIQQALAQRTSTGSGGIELEDAMAVRSMRNLKLAERLLIERRKKRTMEDQDKSEKLQQQNAQVQSQSTQMSEQAKQQTMMLELELYAKEKEIDFFYKEKELQLQSKYKKEEIVVKNEAETEKELVTQTTNNSQE